jgi:hypothetical protein
VSNEKAAVGVCGKSHEAWGIAAVVVTGAAVTVITRTMLQAQKYRIVVRVRIGCLFIPGSPFTRFRQVPQLLTGVGWMCMRERVAEYPAG